LATQLVKGEEKLNYVNEMQEAIKQTTEEIARLTQKQTLLQVSAKRLPRKVFAKLNKTVST
jgi:hypothetical protein